MQAVNLTETLLDFFPQPTHTSGMSANCHNRRIHALLIAAMLLNLVALGFCAGERSQSKLPQISTSNEVDSTACLSAEQAGKKVVLEQLARAALSVRSVPLVACLAHERLHYAHEVCVLLSRIDRTLQSCAVRLQV